MGNHKKRLDPEIINILDNHYHGLSDFINVSLNISEIDKDKEDDENTSIFIWGAPGSNYQSSFGEYGAISVVDGTIASVENLYFDIINAGKDYLYLYDLAKDKVPKGLFLKAIMSTGDDLTISEDRLVNIASILESLSRMDTTSINKLKDNLVNKTNYL